MEEWTRWEPIKGITGQYYIDSFGMVGDEWDFVIKMSNDTQQIEIRFDGMVASYRYTNESYCFGIFGKLDKKYDTDFYAKWSFFKLTHSGYVNWIIEESYDANFTHFCILGEDEMIDIIATHEPEVKILKIQ